MTDSGNVDTLKIEEPHDDAASLAERQRRIEQEQEQDRAFEERLKFAEERKAKQEQDDKAFAERLALAEERKAEQEQDDKAFAERLALAEERKAEQEDDKAFAERLALAEERKAEQEQHNKACAERLALAEERKAKQEQHDVEEEQNHRVLAPHIAGLRRGEASKKIDLKGLHEDRCRRNPSLVKKDPSPFQKVGAGLKKFCEDHGDKIATVVVGAIGLGLALGGSSGNTDISDNSCTRFINRHWATDTQRVYDSGEVVKNAAGRWIEKATGRFVKPMV